MLNLIESTLERDKLDLCLVESCWVHLRPKRVECTLDRVGSSPFELYQVKLTYIRPSRVGLSE